MIITSLSQKFYRSTYLSIILTHTDDEYFFKERVESSAERQKSFLDLNVTRQL